MRDVVDKAFASMDETTRVHIADMLDTAAYAGRMAERERCAKIAEEHSASLAEGKFKSPEICCANTALFIATDIRRRKA